MYWQGECGDKLFMPPTRWKYWSAYLLVSVTSSLINPSGKRSLNISSDDASLSWSEGPQRSLNTHNHSKSWKGTYSPWIHGWMRTNSRQKLPFSKVTKNLIWVSVTGISTSPVNDSLAPSSHAVDQSCHPLLWDGMPLNLQVSEVTVGMDVLIYRSLQLVPKMLYGIEVRRAFQPNHSFNAFISQEFSSYSPSVCRALSSMNTNAPPRVAASGATCGRRTPSTYRCAVRLPAIGTSGVFLVWLIPPHTMTLPLPKAVTGWIQHSACFSPTRRHTRFRPSMCRRQLLVSSVNNTLHRTWALAHRIRACLCRRSKMAFFTRHQARSPVLCNRLLIVCTETLWQLGGRSPLWISVAVWSGTTGVCWWAIAHLLHVLWPLRRAVFVFYWCSFSHEFKDMFHFNTTLGN